MNPVKDLKLSLLVLLLVVSLGTTGYMVIEEWRFLDAFYMTVITLATVGFQEVHHLSDSGRVFTVMLVIIGVTVLGYTVGKLAQIMFEGKNWKSRSKS
jgi:voltage-gated potassium channel